MSALGCYPQVLVQTLTAAAPAAVMETAGGTMLCWKNSILVCGGMDSMRKEHNNVWKWDLGGDRGFQLCHTTGYACCMTPVPVTALEGLLGHPLCLCGCYCCCCCGNIILS